MFRIESYLTPIILSYLDKYVKDVRPQDFQMSLWEGEVTLQNVDLRLDVLEQELHLPFEILSGHIHELNIQIPWTKITSEPIRISISTIEFVLKGKTGKSKSCRSSPVHKTVPPPTPKNDESATMLSTLTMKIVNNISAECQNIIFKYIEDDIVFSMNVQKFCFGAANDKWESSFIDINPTKFLSRKMITICDLTICLDKRNAAGEIECCQEPMLYRCTVQIRILHRHNIRTMATKSVTRVAIFTRLFDFSMSSLQLPMIMRLIQGILLMGADNQVVQVTVPFDDTAERSRQAPDQSNRGGWLSWAWNMLPSFYSDHHEEDELSKSDPDGHVEDIGVYVEEFNLTLKNAECVNDPMIGGMKRVQYSPIIRLTVGGFYYENVNVKEVDWGNLRVGVSSIYIEPLGQFATEGDQKKALVESEPFTNTQAFVDRSLFDGECKIPEKGLIIANYTDYSTRVTDEYLLYRSPILALDLVEYSIPSLVNQVTSYSSGKTGTEAKHKHMRILSTGVIFRFTQTVLQVKNVIITFFESIDFTATSNSETGEINDQSQCPGNSLTVTTDSYIQLSGVSNKTPGSSSPKLHPPLVEDYDQLMQGVPLWEFKVNVKDICIEAFANMDWDSTNTITASNISTTVLWSSLPYFKMRLDHIEGSFSIPLNPDKLVHTTCQLPQKPSELLIACYRNFDFRLSDFSFDMIMPFNQHIAKLAVIPKIKLTFGILLQPEHWKEDQEAVCKVDMHCDQMKVEFSNRQLIASLRLLQAIMKCQPHLLSYLSELMTQPLELPDAMKIHTVLTKIVVVHRQYHTFGTSNIVFGTLHSDVVYGRSAFHVQKYNIINTKYHNNQSKWLECQIQVPSVRFTPKSVQKKHVMEMALGLWIEKCNIILDKHLAEFFSFNELHEKYLWRKDSSRVQLDAQNFLSIPPPYAGESTHSSTLIQPQVFGRGIANKPARVGLLEEAPRYSTDRDEKNTSEPHSVRSSPVSFSSDVVGYSKWKDKKKYFDSVVILIEMAENHLNVASTATRNEKGEFEGEFVHICLPKIVWKSTFADYINRSNLSIRVNPPLHSKTAFNWTIQLQGFCVKICEHERWHTVVSPWHTTFTVAMTYRQRNIDQESASFYHTKHHLIKGKKQASENVPSSSVPVAETYSELNRSGVTAGKIVELLDVHTLNLHIDSSTLHILVEHLKTLRDQLTYLINLQKLMRMPDSFIKRKTSNHNLCDPVKILTATEEDAHLKEFMELDINADISLQRVLSDRSKAGFLAIFCQWTIPKVAVEMKGTSSRKTKIVLELEDLLSTIDQSDDFTKYTYKIGNCSLKYHELELTGTWSLKKHLSVRKVVENNDHPFFNIIVTRASLKDFYKRIGIKRCPPTTQRFITEIIIDVQAIEFIIDLDRVIEFVEPLCVFFAPKVVWADDEQIPTKNQTIQSGSMLPLIHFQSKGLTFLFPLENVIKSCTVLMFKIDGINATSNLKNPLQRIPLRPEVFSKATSMGMLTVPGSTIEDRQYETTFFHMSGASANWHELLAHMREKAQTVYSNPAVEWNNPERKADPEYKEIFKQFTFVCTYAPNIIYRRILICGAATELNCSSDFVATIDTAQMNMISCLLQRAQQINEIIKSSCDYPLPVPPVYSKSQSSSTFFASPQSSLTRLRPIVKSPNNILLPASQSIETRNLNRTLPASQFQSLDENSEAPIKTDSGIQSDLTLPFKCTTTLDKDVFLSLSGPILEFGTITTTVRNVPSTLSLLAGVFIIRIFDSAKYKANIRLDNILHDQALLSFTISQPSFMLTQNIFDSIMQFSIFNIGLHLPSVLEAAQSLETFPVPILDTLPGELSSAGIPPSFFSCKLHRTKLQMREIDMDFEKPLVLTLNEAHTAKLLQNLIIILDCLRKDNCVASEPVRVMHGTKIKLLKDKTLGADRLHLKISAIMINFSDKADYDCKLVFNNLKLHLKYLTKPEKCSTKLLLGSIYLRTMRKIFMHPVSLKASLDLISEPWERSPLVSAAVKFNVIQMDIGIYTVLQLRSAVHAIQRIVDRTFSVWILFQRRRLLDEPFDVSHGNLEPLKCPSLDSFISKRKSRKREEYYQDDLRAGAFQFVELTTDSLLPLPYQIQIIKKDFGIICWRYPQPRKMVKILVNPIPMAVDTPIHIKCRIEYFSEVHERFLSYCDFWLSETMANDLPMPEQTLCAAIWRIVILQSMVTVNGNCFDSNDADDEIKSIESNSLGEVFQHTDKRREFILNPKVLVGCMRIDTIFQSQDIPKLQLMVSCNQVYIKFLNQPDENGDLPPPLKKYRLTKTTVKSQAFVFVMLSNLTFHYVFYTRGHYNLDLELNGNIKCLDYGYLNLIPLLEDATFKCYLHADIMKNIFIGNILCDRLRFNVGPSTLHALLTSKTHWEELLDTDNKRIRHALIPRCVVANRTMQAIVFGQTGTKERVQLNVKECYLYSFDSDFYKQELTFYITDEGTTLVETSQSVHIPFKMDEDNVIYNLRMGNKCLVLKLRKLSGLQVLLMIKGQVELISMVPYRLRVEFRRDDNSKSHAENKSIREYEIDKYDRKSFYMSVNQKSEISIRLKIIKEGVNAYTGEIPLRINKKLPWLVKVPLAVPDFISFWVRILREDVNDLTTETFQPQKILITIWPVFELTSMLTCPVVLRELGTSKEHILEGEGDKHILQVPATHLTNHGLNFLYRFPLGVKSSTTYNLTLKSLDWQKFFFYSDHKWNVESALQILSKPIVRHWPLNDEDELRVRRISKAKSTVDVIYHVSRNREFSCTLSLELSPWGIWINSTGINVRISNLKITQSVIIESNGLEMLFDLSEGFYVEIPDGPIWKQSLPIYFTENSECEYNECYVVKECSPCDVVILRRENVHKFVLFMSIENGRRIFKLHSKFAIVNFSKHCVCVIPFAVGQKESIDLQMIKQLDNGTQHFEMKATPGWENSVGISLSVFYDIHTNACPRSEETDFVYFVSIRLCPTSELSMPIPLHAAIKRHCFSLHNGNESIPLVVTLIVKNNIYYLCLMEDTCPALLIRNEVECSFLVAQTTSTESSTVIIPYPEQEVSNFEWFHVIRKHTHSYYTPPAWYQNFPTVNSVYCNITLALQGGIELKNPIKWSKPINLDRTYKKYVNIPGHGDIQIIVCDKHRVVRLNILYVSQEMEFSVKELRTRLSVTSVISGEQLISSKPMNVPKPNITSSTNLPATVCRHFVGNECDGIYKKFRIYIKEIVLSLHVDGIESQYMKRDLISFFMDDLIFAYDDMEGDKQANILVPNLQIDNQLFTTGNYDFPVLLCSQEFYEKNSQKPLIYYLDRTYACLEEKGAMMEIKMNFYEDEYKIRNLKFRLSPIRIYIEDAYVTNLLDALVECDLSNGIYKAKRTYERRRLYKEQVIVPNDVAAQAICSAEPLHLRSFRIEPMNILLSVHTSVRLYIALDHSPLSFSACHREYLLTSPLKLGQSMGMHYLSGAIFGAGWVVGSLEILGSPSGLARSVSTGVKDFIYLPARGLFRGPWGFIVGVTQGSASLLRNVTAGTVNSVTKLAASVARNLDRLSLDSEHLERTEFLRRRRPQGFTEGLYQGMTGLGISILGAVGGLAHHTLEARTPTEMLTGVGKGLVGALTKPISGAAELLALAGQGMLQTIQFNALPYQRSPTICRNMATEPSPYRLWRMLPIDLLSDQILFYHVVHVMVEEQLKTGYVFLTSTIFAIVEGNWDKLQVVYPVDKVEVIADADDRTKYYVHLKTEKEDIEETMNFTNERIMNFLQASSMDFTSDSLYDLLQTRSSSYTTIYHSSLSYHFYINEHFGEHILQYLKILNVRHLNN
ncbi:vacuolar protein sorting 13B [Glossina fuscipes fuscipes]